MTPDTRSTNVQRFRDEQGAVNVYLLTAVAPFTVSQDRFIVVETMQAARLIVCAGCTPRTALNEGKARVLAPEIFAAFRRWITGAEEAWAADAVPENIHDGVTYIVEFAADGDYRRVRLVAPQPGSPHAALLAAWIDAFEEVRRVVR